MMKSALSKKKSQILTGVIIFLVSLLYRYPQIIAPFWVDEFSSASQAKLFLQYGLSVFSQHTHYIEYHNVIPHLLIAVSFLLFQPSVWAAKIPFVIIGSFFPMVLFFFTKKFFSNKVAISSTLLTICSYWFITWSQQARGYVLQQTLLVLFIWSFLESIKTKRRRWMMAFVVTSILGVLTHITFIFVIGAAIGFFLLTRKNEVSILLGKHLFIVLAGALLGIIVVFFTGAINHIISFLALLQHQGIVNNVWYYHSFLWRSYGVISLLSVLGLLFLWRKNTSLAVLFTSIIGTYLVFHFFIFPPYVIRYLLIIFPLFFMLSAYALEQISVSISKQASTPLLYFLSFFLIINGNIFTLKPKLFYSVNHNVREIALLDYDSVYSRIEETVKKSPGRVAVIDTWPDRRDWYLSEYPIGTYTFRWVNSGVMKQTPYRLNESGEKEIILRPGEKLISSQKDILAIIQAYPQGFLFVDDSTLPKDVIDYAEKNMNKEMYLDHYQFDDNPYSLWPATLYSWGVKR